MLKFRSNNNIVIAPAKTGKENNNKIVVIKTDQGKRGNWICFNEIFFIIIIVTIKFNEPIIEDNPEICKEKIAKSTEGEEWYKWEERGG